MLARLGFRKSDNVRALCVSELNASIQEHERGTFHPWFLEKSWEDTMQANSAFIEHPDDWLLEVEDSGFLIQLPNGTWAGNLNKISYEELQKKYINTDPSLPQAYALFGTKFYLGPIPNTSYNFHFTYIAKTEPIVDNQDEASNKWLMGGFNMITFHALTQVALGGVGAKDKIGTFAARYTEARQSTYKYHESRQSTNRNYDLEISNYGS